MAKINKERRAKLTNAGKAVASLAAMTLLPNLMYASNISFKPKEGLTETLYLNSAGQAIIGGGTTPSKTPSTTPADYDLKLAVNGDMIANRVFNAVWNDLAEYRPVKTGVEKTPGKVYVMTDTGLELSSKKGQLGTVGIYSDTFGYALGSGDNTIPIGISGWVLAYVDQKYPIGTALVSGANGTLTKASICDKIFNSERIVGIVETSPAAYNNLKIDGRYWIKIV